MMPVWIFGIFVVLFIAVIVWERLAYSKLKGEYESIEFFLDLYISKYGNLEGMIVVEEGADGKKE